MRETSQTREMRKHKRVSWVLSFSKIENDHRALAAHPSLCSSGSSSALRELVSIIQGWKNERTGEVLKLKRADHNHLNVSRGGGEFEGERGEGCLGPTYKCSWVTPGGTQTIRVCWGLSCGQPHARCALAPALSPRLSKQITLCQVGTNEWKLRWSC